MASLDTRAHTVGARPPIGGWLILPTIATFVSPFAYLYDISQGFPSGADVLSGEYGTLIISILASDFVFVVGWIWACFALLKRQPVFPGLFAALTAGGLLNLIVAYSLMHYRFQMDFSVDMGRDITRQAIQSMIWVPYILLSRRVKATFGGDQSFFRDREKIVSGQEARVAAARDKPADPEVVRERRRAHRLGIFVLVLGAVIAGLGAILGPSDKFSVAIGMGMALALAGYPMVRLWFWAKAA